MFGTQSPQRPPRRRQPPPPLCVYARVRARVCDAVNPARRVWAHIGVVGARDGLFGVPAGAPLSPSLPHAGAGEYGTEEWCRKMRTLPSSLRL